LLQITRLTKSFGRMQAVRDLSFSVSGGEIVGLLGPNGAGKTTTIRCIASLLRPTTGQVGIGGFDLETHAEEAKRLLAYVPELPNPYEMLTVWEHLRFIAAAYDAEDQMVRGEAVLKRLDLWEKRGELGANLSKGMKQKLACACAFIHRAKVFCFDEPLIGLDPKGIRELKEMLREARDAGAAVLVSTHMLDTAERLCDRVIIMDRGAVIEQGTMDELHARMKMGATLEEMFLQLTERVSEMKAD
jgi:ABC-2 type transport system ATP-binding protein